MKKKMKNNNKFIVNELRYNRCSILLDEVEKNYINESIDNLLSKNKVLELKDITNLIENIYVNSEVRIFSKEHIKGIAVDILDRFKKKLNEEVGRNYQTVDPSPISNEKILSHLNIDQTVCPNTGKWIVTYLYKEKRQVKYFNSEAESNLFVAQLRVN
tara:strand:+ start:177 stop:650 length:474 start_codon:yes stop_codon:yes gene_type:complete